MAMELVKRRTKEGADDNETLFMVGGVALMALGAGLILSNPRVRRYLSQIGVGSLAHAAFPTVERYLKLRVM